MIDLDNPVEPDELYCQLGAALCLGKLPTRAWITVTKYFGVYKYVLPNDRCLQLDLIDSCYRVALKNLEDGGLFWLWGVGDVITVCYTEEEQIFINNILLLSRLR